MDEDSSVLKIKFDGSQLAKGTIDVFDLANSIFALGQTVEAIAKNNGYLDNKHIQINVSA